MPDLRKFLSSDGKLKKGSFENVNGHLTKKMDTGGLKPCALCKKVEMERTDYEEGRVFQISCDCGRGSCSFDELTAIRMWNDQADDKERAETSKYHMEQCKK